MESKFSLTQKGNLVAVAGLTSMVLHHYRIDIAEDEIVAVLGGIITAIGIIVSWIGRYRKGDLTLGGFRK